MRRCWHRPCNEWRTATVHNVLQKRDEDPANAQADPHWELKETCFIYVMFHFPTGRLYVGHTTRTVLQRSKEHWWDRNRLKDMLHQALANDTDPFAFVMLPLEMLKSRRLPSASKRSLSPKG